MKSSNISIWSQFIIKEQLETIIGVLFICLLDTLSKFIITEHLNPGESIHLIPKVFHLTLVYNTGAAFSLFSDHPLFLTPMATVFFIVIFAYRLIKKNCTRLEHIAFMLILGGALGNLVDRWFQIGSVTDFIDFTLINYPVFNLADSFIFIGVVMFLVNYVKQSNKTYCI